MPKRNLKRGLKKRRKRRVNRRPEYPVVGAVKLQKLGKAIYVPIPKAWFKAHRLNPDDIKELLMCADKNILICHPSEVRRIVKSLSKLITKY